MSKDEQLSQGVPALGSLAGYAMSDSDEETEEMHRLSGNISGSDDENSSHSQAPSRNYSPVIKDEEPPKKKVPQVSSLGLVSYGGHEEEDDSDQDVKNSDVENDEEMKATTFADLTQRGREGVVDYDRTFTAEDLANTAAAANGASFVVSESVDSSDVVIPPSPPGSPPQYLVDNITKICRRGQSIDATIQNRKEFRNPSIYEKLLSHVGVNEKGTNYPPELFDPSIWDKNSYYDELSKAQNTEMERRKAEKKVKIDFITATKPSTTDSNDGSGGKKSKWESSSTQPAAANTGGTAAAPAAAAAPPVGSLIKKK